MYTMYSGFMSSFYIFFILWALWDLPHHPLPAWGAFAYFLLLPLLIASISIEAIWAIPGRYKLLVANSIRNRTISRSHAFFIGFTVGFCAVCLVLTLLLVGVWADPPGLICFAGFFIVLITISLSPAVGATWLSKSAMRGSNPPDRREQPSIPY